MTRTVCSVAALLLAGATTVSAADFSFSGNFADDDDVVIFNFSVSAPSVVTLRSYSYAGGTQADGTVVAAGGFDPILALFDSTGLLIDDQDDASDDGNFVPADPISGLQYDVLLEASLAVGDYSVAVSQYDNFAVGPMLGDGFTYTNSPNFTVGIGFCTAGQFCDTDGFDRTSFFAFDVLGVDNAVVVNPPTNPPGSVVPLPAGLPLLAGALGLAGLVSHRARRRAT